MTDLSNSKYVGTWRGVSVSFLNHSGEITADNSLIIKADGTATTGTGDDLKAYIWKETSYGIFLDGKSDLKMYANGDDLEVRFLGIVITYKKQS